MLHKKCFKGTFLKNMKKIKWVKFRILITITTIQDSFTYLGAYVVGQFPLFLAETHHVCSEVQ